MINERGAEPTKRTLPSQFLPKQQLHSSTFKQNRFAGFDRRVSTAEFTQCRLRLVAAPPRPMEQAVEAVEAVGAVAAVGAVGAAGVVAAAMAGGMWGLV